MSKEAASGETRELSSRALLGIASLLYFASGFPFGLVNELLPLYLRTNHVALGDIGVLVSGVSLAWTLKFLWAPLVDRFGSYRIWIFVSLAVIAATTAALASTSGPVLSVIWGAMTALAFASATQDVAIDGIAVVITPAQFYGRVNATRMAAYRAGMMVSGGAIAWIASLNGWRIGFLTAAAIVVIAGGSLAGLPAGHKGSGQSDLTLAFREWLTRPRLGVMIVIVLLYKLADSALNPMVKPFWVDSGYSPGEIGTVTTVIGITVTILGGIIGGATIERLGIYRSLLLLGVFQAGSNGGYAVAAMLHHTRPVMYGAAVVENFSTGLGTAAFMTLLMALCSREHAATEFAVYTALYGVGRTLVGGASGFMVERIGYANFFWFTLLLGVPGLVAVWLFREDVRHLRGEVAAVE
jgi:PAT family beta-lactamase induction signal transducer AmpG